MAKITPQHLQKVEFYSIFLNNIFLFLGISLFGWTLFETLFLFWLEPISALLLLLYLRLIVPIKYGHPGIQYKKPYQQGAAKAMGLAVYTLVMSVVSLLFVIHLCDIEGWDTSQGILHTLSQLPWQLWQGNLLLLSILFLLIYLLPPILLEMRGIQPDEDHLPLQTKIMIHPYQFIANYLWFATLWACNAYLTPNPLVLVLILAVLKSVFEGWLFFRIKAQML